MRSSLLLLVLVLAGCSGKGSDSNSSGAAAGPLAPPAVGIQLATTKIPLAATKEQYSCWSFKVPDSGALSLVGLENQVPTAGIHHWAVFTNSQAMSDAGPYECATMGISWGLVSGGGIGTPGVKFPEGTLMNLVAGQHIIFQLHLLNSTGADMEVAPALINLIGTTATNLQPVGLLIAGTLDITVPAHTKDVAVSGGCKLAEPMEHIFSVFPHMHQRGKRISAEVGSQMLADQVWGFADQKLYPAQGAAVVGDQVKVTCRYDNAGDTDVHFGLSTTDEMCINVLYYYPAKKQSTYCGIGG
jgi:hypothetical protein